MERHRLDLLSLIAGGFFLLVGLRVLAGPVSLHALQLEWLGPAVLVAVGLAMIASVRSRSR